MDLYLARGEVGSSSLYRNNGNGTFTDVTDRAGVGVDNARTIAWADIENDGDIDLFVSQPDNRMSPYYLFRNDGDGSFSDIAVLSNVAVGPWFPGHEGAEPGFGTAWADFNRDGKVDLFVANNTPPDFLFENRGNGVRNHFLILELSGTLSNRSAIGARAIVEAGGIIQVREVEGGANTSQNSLRLEFGLGQANQVDKITIRWPSGLVESTTYPTGVNQLLTIEEGTFEK